METKSAPSAGSSAWPKWVSKTPQQQSSEKLRAVANPSHFNQYRARHFQSVNCKLSWGQWPLINARQYSTRGNSWTFVKGQASTRTSVSTDLDKSPIPNHFKSCPLHAVGCAKRNYQALNVSHCRLLEEILSPSWPRCCFQFPAIRGPHFNMLFLIQSLRYTPFHRAALEIFPPPRFCCDRKLQILEGVLST